MCLAWTVRQRRLGIDDFGNPLTPSSTDPSIIITRGPEDGQPVEDAVHDAVEADVHSDRSADSVTPVDEATPAPAAYKEPALPDEPAANGVAEGAEPTPAAAPEPEVKKPVSASPAKPKARASVSVKPTSKPGAGPTTPTVKKVRVHPVGVVTTCI